MKKAPSFRPSSLNDPVPNSFDPFNAQQLCAQSAEAYRRPRTPEEADAHVHIGTRVRDLIVAFRGTANLSNWLTDLDCELVRLRNFRLHRGFFEAFMAVKLDLDLSQWRLWVTGHSLGGALAELWAWWMAECGHAVAGVYTFGQPRVGDAAFAARYDSMLKTRTFRVVHADDIVPRIPWQLGRYRHAGHEVFFPSPGERAIKRKGRWVQNCGLLRRLTYDLTALARGLGRGKLALVDDHHIRRYQALFPARHTEVRISYSSDFHTL